MHRRLRITDSLIQDYIDGQLDNRGFATVGACLIANPKLAAEVEKMRNLNSAPKICGNDVLDEQVPPNLKNILNKMQR